MYMARGSLFLILALFLGLVRGQGYSNVYEAVKCAVCESTELSGNIKDCCCDANTVNNANDNHVFPILQNLTTLPYFRFFKADLWRDCAFWPDDGQCAQESCAVCECEPDDIPSSYAQELELARHGQKNVVQPSGDCGSSAATSSRSLNPYEAKASAILPSEQAAGRDFATWSVTSGKEERNVWALQDDDSPTIAYMDLLVNPEGYTGYTGPTAWRIWKSIYDENCFPITGKDVDGMCAEQRVFYRLISGLQSSINTHIALTRNEGQPSLQLWLERVGTHPDRLENMYFVYLFLIRALAKARPVLAAMQFDTGNRVEDSSTRQLLDRLLAAPTPGILSAFDESQLFKVSKEEVMKTCPDVISDLSDFASLQQQFVAQNAQKQQLREQLRGAFRNISRVLDCVGCDKCRLWGKIQFLGLGTAMKVLFADSDNVIADTALAMRSNQDTLGHIAPQSKSEPAFQLSQNEVVALVNTLHRLSISVHAVEQFKAAEVREAVSAVAPLFVVAAVMCLALLVLVCMRRGAVKDKAE